MATTGKPVFHKSKKPGKTLNKRIVRLVLSSDHDLPRSFDSYLPWARDSPTLSGASFPIGR
jgi:hypothetical protein